LKLLGSMVAIATPMVAGNAPRTPLDAPALARLVEFHVAEGTDALVAVGTTGESATLDEHEHIEVIRQVVELAAGRLPVIAGTGANATHEAIALTEAAAAAGADACLLVTPYYNKPTQEGLYRHYMAIADAVEIPQILYNVPGRTACDLKPATVARLASHPNIIGIKDATAEIDRVAALRDAGGPEFLLLSGEDISTLDFLLAGGDGVISVTANVAPRGMAELCRLAREGQIDAARALDATLVGLHRQLFVESNPIPTKWALNRMGLIDAGIRLPLTWLSAEHAPAVEAAMRQAGVLEA
jgi:4-hydroxy-tetrahydrodipicolinate synthase